MNFVGKINILVKKLQENKLIKYPKSACRFPNPAWSSYIKQLRGGLSFNFTTYLLMECNFTNLLK